MPIPASETDMRMPSFTLTTLAIAVLMSGSVLAQPRGANPNAPPPGPAPVNEEGRVLLSGATPQDKGVWTPVFGILDPIAPVDVVPFKPWARSLYDARQVHELEPHARCKASGASRQ